MTPLNNGNLQLTQDFRVLTPKSGQAYPIPCDEWDRLKDCIVKADDQPWFFRTFGFLLLGSALTTLITILLGPFAVGSRSRLIAWAVVAVTGISGLLCLLFSEIQRRDRKGQIRDVIVQMATIEKRYERIDV